MISDLKLRPHWLGCGAPGINLFHLTELGVRRTSADSVLVQGRDSGLVLRRSWHWGEISSNEKAALSCFWSCCVSTFHCSAVRVGVHLSDENADFFRKGSGESWSPIFVVVRVDEY